MMHDALTEYLREGTRRLLQVAVEAELEEFLEQWELVRDLKGRKAVVKNGYNPERSIATGIGTINIRMPKLRDRSRSGGNISECLVCTRDYFPEGINQLHSDCTCPLCGEKCISYRNAWSSFQIEHDPDIKTCTPVYRIEHFCLNNKADFPKYKNYLKNHTGDSIPEIRSPQNPH